MAEGSIKLYEGSVVSAWLAVDAKALVQEHAQQTRTGPNPPNYCFFLGRQSGSVNATYNSAV